MHQLYKNIILFSFVVLTFSNFSRAEDILGKVSMQGETFNFELTGQKNWDYDLKKVKTKDKSKVQLFVKALDSQSLESIKNIENPLVESIKIVPQSVDGKTLIEFTLKHTQVETFDYLTDQPSKLIVDFYQSEELDNQLKAPVLLKKNVAPKVSIIKTKVEKKIENTQAADRAPADVDYLKVEDMGPIEASVLSKSGLFDGGDSRFSRFLLGETEYKEEAIIKGQSNYYIRFPILETEFQFWNKMKQNPPYYEILPQATDENKQARLLKKLYDKKRFQVFEKTFEWFKEKYPQSTYLDLLKYMRADSLLESAKNENSVQIQEKAEGEYTLTLNQHPNSGLAERTSLMLGMLALERKDYTTALRRFNTHIQNKLYDGKISQHYGRLGLAYSFSRVKKLDDAIKTLDEITQLTKDPEVLAAAASFRGDFYFHAKKFDQAIQAYNTAIKDYEAAKAVHPSVYFNKMEAQFWTKKYRDSHNSALDFTKYFPSHVFAPFALTRVGELLDLMGADQTKAVGAYLETHFRYGDNPKTIVARLHLLSTRMKSMKDEELKQTIQKMDDLTKKSELDNIEQFKTAMIADGFARRHEYRKAIQILSDLYQKNPLSPDAKQVTYRIVRNINDELKSLADKSDFRGVLKTYKEFSDTWLKGQNRIDTEYLLGLAYENAGAFNISNEKFKKTFDRLEKIKGTTAEKEARVNEYLPSLDSLQLKMALGSYELKDLQSSYQALENIKTPLELSEPEQVARIVLASQLYEQKGDLETSIRYLKELARLWTGDQKNLLPALARLSDLYEKNSLPKESLATYEKLLETTLTEKRPAQELLKQLSRSYFNLLQKNQKEPEAAQLLTKLIDKYSSIYDLSEERYQLGLTQFKKGEIKKAAQTWEQLPEDDTNIWKKLASEKLQQSQWDESYKKHLKRIPAMSQLEEAKK